MDQNGNGNSDEAYRVLRLVVLAVGPKRWTEVVDYEHLDPSKVIRCEGHCLSNDIAEMSFGGPGGGQKAAKPIPPEKGSFPLDHDGECKPIIAGYLRCLRRVNGKNATDCRMMAKEYLKCRMDHNLMAPDEMKNLGFAEDSSVDLNPIDRPESPSQKSPGKTSKAS